MSLLGYCRVSTERQSLDQQVDALTAAGVEKIFTDKRSGAREDRDGLAELLAYARPGDTIVIWRLDRLGRSLSHIVRTVADLQNRGIYLRALQDGADSSTSTGRMMIGVLASLAEYERELIAERATAAREAARDRGRQVGRPAALTPDQTRQVRTLHASGESVPSLVRSFAVSRATIYRALAESSEEVAA